MNRTTFKLLVGAVLSSFALAPSAHAAFTINVNFTGGLTASQQAIFTNAASFWQSVIVDYKPGVTLTGITISAAGQAIDGVGGVLGNANPTNYASQLGSYYSTAGAMRFDSADLANLEASGQLLPVITHEMGHVLGLGTLWQANGLYVNNTGRYTGAQALAMWQAEFNMPLATFVPVELDGGAGTANAHWDELPGGSGLTGRVDNQGRDMRDELMTGWLNPNPFVSLTTIAQFGDLGYSVVVPEPSVAMSLAPAALLLKRRRR